MACDLQEHLQQIQRLIHSETPFVTVTMVEARGSAPQIQGAKAIITADGIVQGTVGGGKVEAKAIQHAQSILEAGDGRTCDFITWNLQTEVGMTCGGEVRFFFEVHIRNDWKIAVFGAGHVAQTLVPMLLQLQCSVTCLDQRAEWLDKLPSHSRLRTVCEPDLKGQVKHLDPRSFFVLMTQGHATDLPVLAEILTTGNPPFVGVIGSLQKAKILRRNLKEMGVSSEKIESFYCPMGMPIGNNTPPEISISIMAQLIQQRDRQGIIKHKSKEFAYDDSNTGKSETQHDR